MRYRYRFGELFYNCTEDMAFTSLILKRWNSDKFKTFFLENVDLESKVEVLKSHAFFILKNTNIELSFGGEILENNNTLSYYGVTEGVTIHVLDKLEPKKNLAEKKYTDLDVQHLVSAVRTFTLTSGCRAALQKLSRQDVINKVIEATPGLAFDPVAVAIIRDPELFVHLADPETVRKVAKDHPSLLVAAVYIMAHIREDQMSVNHNQPGTSTGYSYSLDALSDEEDMDSTSDTSVSQNPLSRNASFNAITAAQLAAAIANATNTQFNTNSAGIPSTSTSGRVITSEMFTNAIQQAFNFSGSSNRTGFSPISPNRDEETLENITRRLQPQLQQMHEIGLFNDIVNIRALQATSGDVNSAIELVFNGVID